MGSIFVILSEAKNLRVSGENETLRSAQGDRKAVSSEGRSTNGGSTMTSIWVPFVLSLSKDKRRFLPFALALVFLSPPLSLAFAQAGGIPHIELPPLVRIVGAFAPVDDTQR